MLVMESAQLMAAKRCDCVLVIDDDDHLSGIFTVGFNKRRVNKKFNKLYFRQKILHIDSLQKI